MASGDDRQRGLTKNIFGRCSKKAVVSRPAHTEGTSSSQPATQSQPSPPLPTPAASSPQFYSPDPHLPSPDLTQTTPFYPYYPPPPYHGAHPPYLFHLSKDPTHKIRDIIRSRYDAPYISWKKVPKEVRDIWFREFEKQVLGREPTPVELHSHTHKRQEDQQWIDERARRAYEDYTRLRESQAAAGEGSSAGSTDYSDYRTWSQAVGGIQHGRVYGLGSQAYAYEGQSSSGGSFSSSTQESLYTQQIAALTAELEQVRKAQANWQMQMQQQQMQIQQQQAQMLKEMRKMREQMSSGRSTTEDETESE
ncbi:hypothetical protein IEQ34_002819 [Dendrobium chrysotoxum]|uniref:Uncharacterized protein n=1 Tax=Dendrobium chrysotoxum TaxID=161865 RepID=A0AAV7HFF9_DENCH|nr:hypothetical protein IEQ34_002819 [Dendrobium chrysotoxum]